MNAVGLMVIVCVFCVGYIYIRIKRFPILMLDNYVKQNNFEEAIKTLEKSSTKKLMKPLEYDRIRLKVMFRVGKKAAFQEMIQTIGQKKYKDGNAIELLEKWLHLCLAHRDEPLAVEFAQDFVNAIKIHAEENVAKLAELSYDILVNKKKDGESFLLSYCMRGRETNFRCGLGNYLLGKLCELQFDIKGAVRWYDSALTQFDCINSKIYYQECKDYIDQYGDKTSIHYGVLKTELFEPIDMVKTYRYEVKNKKKS